jgi:hypothetical protein
LWLGSLGQVIPNGIDNLTLEDPVFGKLVHDFIQDESGRETVAGIGIPLHYVPLVIATLVLICAILLVGTASALLKAEEFPESFVEEFGWSLLETDSSIGGRFNFLAGILLVLLTFSLPLLAEWRVTEFAMQSFAYTTSLWILGASIIAFMCALGANFAAQLDLRNAIRKHRDALNRQKNISLG